MCSFLLEGLCNSPSWLVGAVQYSLHQIIKKKKSVPQCGEVLASYITIIAMQVCMLSHALSFTSMLTSQERDTFLARACWHSLHRLVASYSCTLFQVNSE